MKVMSNLYRNTSEISKEELRALIESDLKKDLHMHTRHSDGALTPQELIELRASEGYELLAITDHDVMGGSVEGANYAREKGIQYIYGIEFDSEDVFGKDLHILGYGLDIHSEPLLDKLIEVLDERNKRNEKLMNALNKRGYGITVEDVKAVNNGRYVGKPTFAQVLVNKGYAKDVQEVFATVFREDDIRAIKKVTEKSKVIIDTIHAADGLAVMAHPMEQRHLDESFEEFKPRLYDILDKMVAYGVDGIECHHPSANEMQQELLLKYTKERGLMVTRGSDFHSPYKPRDYSRYHRP